MPKHRNLIDTIDAVTDWTGRAVSFLIVLMMAITLGTITLRYFFNLPFFFDPQSSIVNILSVYIILGAAYTLQKKSYISADIFTRRLTLRGKAAMEMATASVIFFFLVTMLWASLERASATFSSLRLSFSVLLPSQWPVLLFWPPGIILILIQGMVHFARNAVILVTGEEYE